MLVSPECQVYPPRGADNENLMIRMPSNEKALDEPQGRWSFLPVPPITLLAESSFTAYWQTVSEWSLALAWPAGLMVACGLSWLTNLVALPGNWVCVLLLLLYAWGGPESGPTDIGYGVVAVSFALALVGELLEFSAGAVGAKRAGASRKSTLYSILGSVAGAIVGALVGVPIPVVGSVIAAILFGGIGAAAGAMYGEWTDGRQWGENWSVGKAALVGRTLGVLSKFAVGGLILLVALVSLLVA